MLFSVSECSGPKVISLDFCVGLRASSLFGWSCEENLLEFFEPVTQASPAGVEEQVMQQPGQHCSHTGPCPVHLNQEKNMKHSVPLTINPQKLLLGHN